MNRRLFLRSSFGAVASVAALPCAASQASVPPIALGFDSYTLRAFQWKAPRLLEYAASQKLDAIQFSSLNDFETLDDAYLAKVKEQAARLGIAVDGGIGCICSSAKGWRNDHGTPAQYLTKGIRVTKAIGAKAMRCYMGNPDDRAGSTPMERHIENTLNALRSVRTIAQDAGVTIAIENHGDLQAREMKDLIEAAGKDYVGACLDSGNPMLVIEDPLVTLDVLGSYTVTTHIRDYVVFEHPRGAAGHWVRLGDGVLDLKRFVERYRQLCPNAAMQLEIITGRPPQVFPYLEPSFWDKYPKASAAEFARFVALARNGHPLMATMVVADVPGSVRPPEFDAALREQQRIDLERSFEYARKTLDVGIRWRKAGG